MTWPYHFWIAHRGAGKNAPENTMAAFRMGANAGYQAFECDVTLSLDDEPFLLHDATLERTTSGHGSAHARTWAELRKLDAGLWHSTPFANEPLPHLTDIASFCIQQKCAINLELKPQAQKEHETGRVVASQAAKLWAHSSPLPLISSFEPMALQGARDGAAHLPRALLLERIAPDSLLLANQLGCLAIVCHYSTLDPINIKQIHDQGMRCLAYTVNTPLDANRLIQAGIDGLITDAIPIFSPKQPPASTQSINP
jgi:glycerophosphoryl diester phosphodiesterase